MIRMLFALLVTLAGFLAASFWWARDTALAPAESPVAIESPPAEPVPLALPAPEMPPAPPDAVADAVEIAEEIEEERVSAPAAFEPDEPPGNEAPRIVEVAGRDDPTGVSARLDQDAWAELIRRMLSLYRRTGAEAR